MLREIRRLGFVQLDSISVVERAHHHILYTRLHTARPATLSGLHHSGKLFEHWTHDASLIPSEHFPHWKHRFERVSWDAWIRRRMGPDGERVAREVLERIRAEGPLRARDFEHPDRRTGSGGWWDWKPAKAALEYLWRSGQLAIARRERFEKVYNLTERVLPDHHSAPASSKEAHTEWACAGALERLGIATAKEIAAFWNAIPSAEAQRWCNAAVKAGRILPVRIETDDRRALSYALPGFEGRITGTPPETLRLLSPFDPLIRDRARCERLFHFRYRFEAFTPEAKRTHGYYILPILRGDRLIGRVDPRLDRASRVLHINNIWWERGARPNKKALREALGRYAAFCSADHVEVAPGA